MGCRGRYRWRSFVGPKLTEVEILDNVYVKADVLLSSLHSDEEGSCTDPYEQQTSWRSNESGSEPNVPVNFFFNQNNEYETGLNENKDTHDTR